MLKNLTFQEKSLWIVLLSMLFTFGLYFSRITPPVDGNISGGDVAQFIAYVVIMIVLAIAAHVILASKSAAHCHQLEHDGVVDERQKMIELKANAIGGHVLGVGVIAAMALGLWKPGNYWVIQGLVISLLISELINISLQLYYYRRGF